ncbi:MAG: glycosyltransferase [Acidimicrobiia bacterium]|nr:glycosyltransferase [Acidimicrobiia bacterium]
MQPRWTGPENDYRGILDLPSGADPTVAVIIPAHQRPDVLERTLAGLVAQRDVSIREVVVVDDDSPDPLGDVVGSFAEQLPVSYVRTRFEGFGAGPARNLGVDRSTADIVLFLDSDCIPDPSLVATHLRWHRRVSNAVVAGSRVDVDASSLSAAEVLSEGIAPQQMGASTNAWDEVESSDWRPAFFRSNRRLVIDDTAFRAALSNNLSMTRATFTSAGGFSSLFVDWGSEDTEFGWRLFQDGNFVVPDEGAVVYHQIQHDDPQARRTHRERARSMNLPLLADSIPNHRYRRVPASTYTVPQLSWLVHGSDTETVDRQLRWIDDVAWLDNEVVVVGPPDAVERWRSRARASDRFRLVETVEPITTGDVLGQIRGEYIAFLGAMRSADRSLPARAMKRMESDRRLAVVRAPYVDAEGATARRIGDLEAYDSARGFPAFAIARRRSLAKHERTISVVGAVAEATQTERVALVSNPKVRVEATLTSASRLDPATAVALGPAEIARSVSHRVMPSRSASRSQPGQETPDPRTERIGVSYIGFTGRRNLGDEAIMAAVSSLLPQLELRREHSDPEALMVGGGTIVNAKGYYLTRVLREDRPGIARFVFAPGVRDPAFWGITENMDDWFSFFRDAEPVTVRGPDSAEHLRVLGWRGDIEIIGDPALSLEAPPEIVKSGEVIVAPLHTGGNLYGEDDDAVLGALAAEADRLVASGRPVTLMASFPEDDRWILELERAIGSPVGYFCGYDDLDATMRRIGSADLVIGERMHANILAAATRTPFVAIAYRPKTLDFARSIDAERWTVRTDETATMPAVVDAALEDDPAIRAHLDAAVSTLVATQRGHANRIMNTLRGVS